MIAVSSATLVTLVFIAVIVVMSDTEKLNNTDNLLLYTLTPNVAHADINIMFSLLVVACCCGKCSQKQQFIC